MINYFKAFTRAVYRSQKLTTSPLVSKPHRNPPFFDLHQNNFCISQFTFGSLKDKFSGEVTLIEAQQLEVNGVNYLKEDKIPEALEEFQKAILIRSNLRSEDNDELVSLYESLFQMISQSEHLEKLLKIEETRLNALQKFFGEKSKEYASCSRNIGHILNLLNRTSEAKPFLSTVVGTFTEDSVNDLNSAKKLEALSSDLIIAEDYQGALSASLKCLETYSSLFELNNPSFPHENVGNVMLNMGICLTQFKEYSQAQEVLVKAIHSFERLNYEHEDLPLALYKLGQAYYSQNMVKLAEENFIKAFDLLRLKKNHRPIDKLRIAEALDFLGRTYYKKGEFEKALGYQKQGFGMLWQILGEDQLNVIMCEFYVGKCYLMLEKYQEALETYESVSRKLKNKHLKNSEIINVCCDMSVTLQYLGRHREGLNVLVDALNLSAEFGGLEQVQYARIMYHMGMAYSSLGDNEKAIEYIRAALPIFKYIYGNNDDLTKTCRNELKKHKKALSEKHKIVP